MSVLYAAGYWQTCTDNNPEVIQYLLVLDIKSLNA